MGVELMKGSTLAPRTRRDGGCEPGEGEAAGARLGLVHPFQ